MKNNGFPSINALPATSALIRARQFFSKRLNVLCVEDRIEICELLRESILPSPLFNIKSAHTTEMAKTAVQGHTTYHCWLLDLSLQKHNDAMELLKIKPNFPFCVVLSGAQSMNDATAAIKAGVFSAYDKKSIFVNNPHPFISDVCALSVLSFLLKARKPARFDLYQLLLSEFIKTPEDWSAKYCLNERTLRNICEDDSLLTPKQFLSLFHALNALLFSDCIVHSMEGSQAIRQALVDRRDFYNQCLEYVARTMDAVYGPKLLGN